jgi:hypothetical protein
LHGYAKSPKEGGCQRRKKLSLGQGFCQYRNYTPKATVTPVNAFVNHPRSSGATTNRDKHIANPGSHPPWAGCFFVLVAGSYNQPATRSASSPTPRGRLVTVARRAGWAVDRSFRRCFGPVSALLATATFWWPVACLKRAILCDLARWPVSRSGPATLPRPGPGPNLRRRFEQCRAYLMRRRDAS